MTQVRQYKKYSDYIDHQKEKTLDPVRRKKWLNEEWQLKLDGFKEAFKPYEEYINDSRALCIGARTGQEVEAMIEMGADAVGVDICPHPPNVIEGDMHELPFQDNSFDFTFSNVLDHSLYPSKKISEIERVLSPNGIAVLHLQVNTPSDIYTETEVNDVYYDVITLFKNSVCKEINRLSNPVFATMNIEIVMQKLDANFDLEKLNVPESYMNIWKDVNLKTQIHKATTHGLTKEQAEKCFSQLSLRPYYLASIAKDNGCKTFVEIGTAKGLQSFSFAEYIRDSNIDGHVWTCDINDVRNKEYESRYEEYVTFCLGDRSKLATVLKEQNAKIDMFYIDGAHGRGDVIRDVYHMKKFQSENPIWVFDDFDKRFGCYNDILSIMKISKNFRVYYVGQTASGNSNHQVIIYGKL